MIYKLITGEKGPQVAEMLPGDELKQPRHTFIIRDMFPTRDQADAALLALKIRMCPDSKRSLLTQAELYVIAELLENVAYGMKPM